MTAASIFRSLPTAHDAFKGRYRVSIRAALAATLALHALAFLLIPAFPVRPYRLPPQDVVETVDLGEAPELPAIAPRERPLPAPPAVLPFDPSEPAPGAIEPPMPPPATPGPAGPRAPEPPPKIFLWHDAPPVVTRSVSPRYPRLAREAGLEGRVVVRVLVDVKGRVTEAVVLEADATPEMVESALSAARGFRFEPARQREVAVPAHVTIPFAFSLR
jgi:protein TonB